MKAIVARRSPGRPPNAQPREGRHGAVLSVHVAHDTKARMVAVAKRMDLPLSRVVENYLLKGFMLEDLIAAKINFDPAAGG